MKTITAVGLTSVCMVLSACSGSSGGDDGPPPLTVPKAACGSGDKPETALQGQVPASMRSNFGGFSCNLQLIGQSKGDGANWQTTQFRDKAGRRCAYHGTAFTTENRTFRGVPTIDITDPAKPTPTAHLTTVAMLDPWESLKVNERRQLLAADNANNGGFGAGGPEIDIYDLSGDCRNPQLLTSVAVGKADGTTGVPAKITGHEGAWAPDGLTYYWGDIPSVPGGQYAAVDVTNPTRPALLTTWQTGVPGGNVHGFSISDDGKRGYFVSLGSIGSFGGPPDAVSAPANNGLLIYDLSEIQSRKANPQVREVGRVLWKDGSVAQHTIPVKIGGKPYIIFVDEGGSLGAASTPQLDAACAAGLPPFPMARIIDIADETKPTIVSRLMLEIHDPIHCDKVKPDLVGLNTFTYGSHYCSVDNKQNATTLACGYFNSGLRVFDIRDPLRPKEIAYYNPAGTTTPSPGSNHVTTGNWRAGGPDWCSAQVHLDAATATMWSTCQDNGMLMLKFTNGVWPFPESATPAGEQN